MGGDSIVALPIVLPDVAVCLLTNSFGTRGLRTALPEERRALAGSDTSHGTHSGSCSVRGDNFRTSNQTEHTESDLQYSMMDDSEGSAVIFVI